MKNLTIFSLATIAILSFSGCSNKNILMPGKYKSDCEKDGGAYGMCGSPKNIYKYQTQIEQVDTANADSSFHIDDNGNIQKIEEGELQGPAQFKTGVTTSGTTQSVVGTALVQNRNYMLSNKPKSSIIRSMEVIRRVWLNTYKDSINNLIGEHDIYVVTKKADWTVGENTPVNVKKAKMVPSIVTKEAITESHAVPTMQEDAIIKEYLK